MPKAPRVSVIIPSYNQADTIKQSIDSILSQNIDVEIIVIDGASTDQTRTLLESYGSKIRWQSKKDKGQTDAINQGIALATGDIIAYLNSDDYYLPGTLIRVVEYFTSHPTVDWLTGYCTIVTRDGSPTRSWITRYKNVWLNHYTPTTLQITNYISQPATFWRRSLHQQIGLFDDQLTYVMDYDFWLRAASISRPGVIRHPLTAFRIYANSKSGGQFRNLFQEDQKIAQKYAKNPLTPLLHKLHNAVILLVYSRLNQW